MISLLQEHGIELPLARRLADYAELVLAGNARCNLTSARTPEAIVPHLLDSLSFLGDVRGPLIDVGSGAGFPAIPIALATGVEIVMIESVAKKAKFLRDTVQALGLEARVLIGRAERFGLEEEYRATFACATARAVAVAPTVLEYLLPFLHIDGLAILQRGALDDPERSASNDAALMLGGEIIEERLLEGQRRLLIARKIRTTPWRFPRKNGTPVKQPLCLHNRIS